MTSRTFQLLPCTLALVLAAWLSLPAPAKAGYYTVPGTCGQWAPWGSGIAIYPACPDLIARNIGQAQLTAAGVGGGWRFDLPPGTAVASANLHGSVQGSNGWQANVYTEGISAREFTG